MNTIKQLLLILIISTLTACCSLKGEITHCCQTSCGTACGPKYLYRPGCGNPCQSNCADNFANDGSANYDTYRVTPCCYYRPVLKRVIYKN